MNKLLGCPLCGSAGKIVSIPQIFGLGGASTCYAPYCTNTDCHLANGLQRSYGSEDEAAKEWNTRYETNKESDNG